MGRLFDVHLDTVPEAGGPLRGRVAIVAPGDVRRVMVEVVRVEQTAGAAGVGEAVVASVELCGARSFTGTEVLTFSITLPTEAGPEIVTARSRVHWALRARADVLGPDLVESVALRVQPNLAEPSPSLVSHLAEGPAVQERDNRRTVQILAGTFAGFGVVFTVLTVLWSSNPPEAWDGETGALWFTAGLAILMLAAGGLSWRSTRRRDLAGVVIRVPSPVRLGELASLPIEISNHSGGTVHVGRLCVEFALTERAAGRYRSVEHREHLLDQVWVEAPPGEHRVEMPWSATVPPSTVGDRVSVDHRLVAVRRRARHPLRARERHLVRFVVLP